MSFSKNKRKESTKQSQQSTSTTSLDPWTTKNFQDTNTKMNGIIDQYASNPTPPTAGMSPEQVRARDLAGANVGNYQGLLNESADLARQGANYDLTDVSKFNNIHERDVTDAAGAYYDEQLAKQTMQNQARAQQSGAYGGSRHGVADGELQRTAQMDKAQMMAKLRYEGYANSQRMAQVDMNNKYTGSNALGVLAGQTQQLGQNDVAMLEKLGATTREIEQAKIDGTAQKLFQELQMRMGVLGQSRDFAAQTNTSSGSGTSSGTSKSSGFNIDVLDFVRNGFSPTK